MNRQILEAAARAAHESNRAFSIARGAHSIPHWEQLPQSEQEVTIRSVRLVAEGCSARELHAGWASDKVQLGWRPGPKRDVMAREHPCLADWESLPPVERDRDHLFVEVARAVLKAFPLSGRLSPERPEARGPRPEGRKGAR